MDTIKIYLLLSSTSGILYAEKTIIVMLTIQTVAIHPLSCLLKNKQHETLKFFFFNYSSFNFSKLYRVMYCRLWLS